MEIPMIVDLDSTLGCGQAHRWIRKNDGWEGVIDRNIIFLKQTENGFDCQGCSSSVIKSYFRYDDDINKIYNECASNDEYVASLMKKCYGLRILNQPHWECLATYVLATNANVKRIGSMVESVCKEFGRNLGERFSFPSPSEIIEKKELLCKCKLGYREERFLKLAKDVESGVIDLDYIESLDYDDCIKTLMKIDGVGPKVADCVSLFSYNHLDAFPIDARISNVLKNVYNVEGSYKKLSAYSRKKFGKYCGYSQEFLYHSGIIESQPHSGGLQPNSTS